MANERNRVGVAEEAFQQAMASHGQGRLEQAERAISRHPEAAIRSISAHCIISAYFVFSRVNMMAHGIYARYCAAVSGYADSL